MSPKFDDPPEVESPFHSLSGRTNALSDMEFEFPLEGPSAATPHSSEALEPYLTGEAGLKLVEQARSEGASLSEMIAFLVKRIATLATGEDPVPVEALHRALGTNTTFFQAIARTDGLPGIQTQIFAGNPEGLERRMFELAPFQPLTEIQKELVREGQPLEEVVLSAAAERRAATKDARADPVGSAVRGFSQGLVGLTEDTLTNPEYIGQLAGSLTGAVFAYAKVLKTITGGKTILGAIRLGSTKSHALASGIGEMASASIEAALTKRTGGVSKEEFALRVGLGFAIPPAASGLWSVFKKGLQLMGKGGLSPKKLDLLISDLVSEGRFATQDEFLQGVLARLREQGVKIKGGINTLRKSAAIQQFFKRAAARAPDTAMPVGKSIATIEKNLDFMKALRDYMKDDIFNNRTINRNATQQAAAWLQFTNKNKSMIQRAEASLKGFRSNVPSELTSRVPSVVEGIPLDRLPPVSGASRITRIQMSRMFSAMTRRKIPVKDVEDLTLLRYGKRISELNIHEADNITKIIDEQTVTRDLLRVDEAIYRDIDPAKGVHMVNFDRQSEISRNVFTYITTTFKNFGPMGEEVAQRLQQWRIMSDIQRGVLFNTGIKDVLDGLGTEIQYLPRVAQGFLDRTELKALGLSAGQVDKLFDAAVRIKGMLDVPWKQFTRMHPGEASRYFDNYFPHLPKDKKLFATPDARLELAQQVAKFTRNNKTGKLVPRAKPLSLHDAMKHVDDYLTKHADREFGNLTRTRSTDLAHQIPYLGDSGNRKEIYEAYYSYITRSAEENQLELFFGPRTITRKAGDVSLARIPGFQAFEDAVTKVGGPPAGEFVSSMFTRIRGGDLDITLGSRVLRAARDFNVFLRLGNMQIANMGQFSLTMTESGIKSTLRSIAQSAGLVQHVAGMTKKEAARFAHRSGIYRSMMQDYMTGTYGVTGKLARNYLKWTGGLLSDNFQRFVAFRSGLEHMGEVIAGLKTASGKQKTRLLREMNRYGFDDKRIKELINNPQLSELEELRVGAMSSRFPQFLSNPEDLPPLFTQKYGRDITQFKSFMAQYMGVVKNRVFGELWKGNPRPFLGLVVGAQIGGEVVNDVKMLLRGTLGKGTLRRRDEPQRKITVGIQSAIPGVRGASNVLNTELKALLSAGSKATNTHIGRVLAAKIESGQWHFVDRAIDNFLAIGGFGAWSEMLSFMQFDNKSGAIEFGVGPSGAAVMEIFRMGTQFMMNPNKVEATRRTIEDTVRFTLGGQTVGVRNVAIKTVLDTLNIKDRPRRPAKPEPR